MPMRDLRGQAVPVGKVARQLRYDGLVGSLPDWVSTFGEVTLTKDDVATSRGELHVDAAGGVGGIELPALDPGSFRELRLRAGLSHEMGDEATMRFGFADAGGTADPSGWCYYREAGESEQQRGGAVSCGRLWYGRDGDGSTTGDLTIVLDASGGATILEVRIRPYEQGVTVAIDGADRGDVIFEETDSPYRLDPPVYPRIEIDAGGNDQTERLSISTLGLTAVHN